MDQLEQSVSATDVARLLHLQSILDYNSDWIWEVDAAGRYTYSSPACRTLLGREPEEVVGKTPFDFMPLGEKERVARIFGRYAERHEPFKGLVNRNVKADGSIVILETSGVPLFAPDGQFTGYRGIDRDITDIGERFLQLEAVYDLSPVALCVIDKRRRFMMVNAAFSKILHMPAGVVEGQSVGTLMPDLEKLLVAHQDAACHGSVAFDGDVEVAGRWYHPTIKSFGEHVNDRYELSVALTDITAQKNVEQELARMNRMLSRHAHEDYLTGLYNRRHLDGVLRTELARARREGLPTSLLIMDLDHFKQYNDRYGHQAGDECLRLVADKLATVVNRGSDCLGRYGGEEFLAILPNTPGEGALALARRIQDAMRFLEMPEGANPRGGITLSLGVSTLLPALSLAPFDADAQAQQLVGAADQALYRAKGAGRNQIVTQPALRGGS